MWCFLFKKFKGDFFNYCIAAPWPTLGHCQGGSITNPVLITGLDSWFNPEVTGILVRRMHVDQSILHFFLLSLSLWKGMAHKPPNIAAATNQYNLLLISVIGISLPLPWGLFQPPCYCILGKKCFERGPYRTHILQRVL